MYAEGKVYWLKCSNTELEYLNSINVLIRIKDLYIKYEELFANESDAKIGFQSTFITFPTEDTAEGKDFMISWISQY